LKVEGRESLVGFACGTSALAAAVEREYDGNGMEVEEKYGVVTVNCYRDGGSREASAHQQWAAGRDKLSLKEKL
jgi:hypothetical protein